VKSQERDCGLRIADCGLRVSLSDSVFRILPSAFSLQPSAFRRLRIFSLLLLTCVPSACGYHLSGALLLPQGIQRVSFAEFTNETLEVGVEKELQWALEREFRNRGGVTVADDGDGVVNVTLRQLDLRPFSLDSRDQVLEYEIAMVFDVNLVHRESGQVVWQANNLRVTEDYSAIPQVMVTTSPEFLRGNLNPEDLSGLTDIQFSEAQRRLAVERLFAAAAREVYFRLGENF
jgi:outer membrane lipopolysaccharide assembly protein LptE/RlpB